MTERSVSVRLKLLNAEYRKGMAEATGDTTKFAATAKGAFTGLGDQLKQAGGTMTRNVTLPLVGIGVAATKLGNDFETTFAHMVGLANVPKAEIDGLKQSVLALSHETARSPQELAEALYYIRSSGISASKSLDVLKVSAQAAAAGLGSAQDIAKAVGFAINAYGEENLSAAKATDVLVATIREGTIEAGDLAPVMGMLIPTASALGISFESVAGTMAVMSKNGASASDSATGLSAVMSTLLGTSAAGQQILEDNGLSLKQLRDIAAGPGGLVAVFRTLDQTFQGNDEALATVIPNIRALRTFMNVLSQDTAGVDKTLQAVTNSAGATATAFDAVAHTKAFQIKQDLNDAKVALVNLGGSLAPLVAGIAGLAAGFLAAFGHLPTWLQAGIGGFVGLLAAIGPIISITGRVLENFKLLATGVQKAFSLIQTGALNAVGNLGAVGVATAGIAIAVTALAYGFITAAQNAAEAKARVQGFTDSIREAGDAAEGAAHHLKEMFEAGDHNRMLQAIAAAGVSLDEVSAAAAAGGQAWEDYKAKLIAAFIVENGPDDIVQQLQHQGTTVDELAAKYAKFGSWDAVWKNVPSGELVNFSSILKGLGGDLNDTGSDISKAMVAAGLLDRVLGDTATSSDAASGGLHRTAAEVQALTDKAYSAEQGLKDLLGAFDSLYAGAFAITDAQLDYVDALAQVGTSSDSAGGSTRNLVAEQHAAVRSAEAITKAQLDLAAAEAALVEARKGPTDRDKKDAGLGVREANLGLKEAQKAVADAQKNITEEQKKGKDGDVKSARLALERASINLVRAQEAVSDAQAKQNEVMATGTESSKKVMDAVDAVTAAQLQLRDAQWAQEEAQNQSVAGTGRVIDKQKELAGQLNKVVESGDAVIRKMIEQGRPGGEVLTAIAVHAAAVQGLIDKYGDVNGKLHEQLDFLLRIAVAEGLPLTTNPETGWVYPELPKVPGKAGGGPFQAGQAYMVGERGPELAVFGSPGTIIPNHALSTVPQGQLTAAASYSSGPTTIVIKPTEVKMYLDRNEIGVGVVKWSHEVGGADFRTVNH